MLWRAFVRLQYLFHVEHLLCDEALKHCMTVVTLNAASVCQAHLNENPCLTFLANSSKQVVDYHYSSFSK
jgi:hypothetical protein